MIKVQRFGCAAMPTRMCAAASRVWRTSFGATPHEEVPWWELTTRLALKSGRVVGLCTSQRRREHSVTATWVTNLCVAQRHRGRGIATRLLQAVQESEGRLALTAEDGLAPFYRNHGFAVHDTRRGVVFVRECDPM